MSTVTTCKAKNPALCPYHGNKFYSKESLSKALDKLDPKKELIFLEENNLAARDDYLKKQAVFREAWTEEEKTSIYFYTYQSHRVVNLWLSNEKYWVPNGWPEMENNIVKNLDALIKRYGKHEEEQTFYRGVSKPELMKGLKKGSIFSTPSFMSTTSDAERVTIFVDDNNPMILKVRTKQGAPISLNYPMEYEYVLARNTQFKVASITKKANWTIQGDDFAAGHSKKNVTIIELIDLS